MNVRGQNQIVGFALRVLVLLSLVLPAALAMPQSASAIGPVCRVDPLATGTGTGGSWVNAMASLQTALNNTHCTEIWVKGGEYRPGGAQTDTFHVHAGQKVYGSFGGTETTRSQRDPYTYLTILSGDIGGDDDSSNADGNSIDENASEIVGNNNFHVVTIGGTSTDVTSTTVLDSFLITAGDAHAAFIDGGGGLVCDGSGAGRVCSPTLSHLSFVGNHGSFGGAVETYGIDGGVSSPTFSAVTFSGNTATDGGGLLSNGFNGKSSPKLTNVTFYGNSASGEGGAFDIEELGAPVLKNVTFSLNSAGGFGGAIVNAGTAKLSNAILWGDSAGTGPEIYNGGAGTVKVDHSDIQGGCGSIAGATCGSGNRNADPLLVSASPTNLFEANMPLGLDSPAVDHGTNTGCPATDERGVSRPMDGDGNGTNVCDMGATESHRTTVTLRSQGSLDGWLRESAEGSGVADELDSASSTLRLGDDASNRTYMDILSFSTFLPATATVTSARLQVRKAGQVGANPFATLGDVLVDLRQGSFSNDPTLQTSDYNVAATISAAMTIHNNPVNGWYSGNLPSLWLGFINPAPPTQFRLRSFTDDNNNNHADYLKFYSGNASQAYRPKLILKYYMP